MTGLTARAAAVSDACDAQGLGRRTLGPDFLALKPGTRMMGRAYVVKTEVVDAAPETRYAGLLPAIDALGEGEIYVISGHGRADVALWGELLSTKARAAGSAGALIDGPVRDVAQVSQLDFPVFARGRCPADIHGRMEVTGTGGTITVDGVPITHGDLVVADDDGVVVVPADAAESALAAAREKLATEQLFAKDVASGLSAAEAFRRHGVL
jgi:4-hydroxy-4-methyl-2-oxoglutarate aldolase